MTKWYQINTINTTTSQEKYTQIALLSEKFPLLLSTITGIGRPLNVLNNFHDSFSPGFCVGDYFFVIKEPS